MDNPAGKSLMDLVRRANQIGRGGPNQPEVEDYLREISADPLTEWFTELLREKNQELAGEKAQSERLADALRDWYTAKTESPGEAESQLADVLQEMRIINP